MSLSQVDVETATHDAGAHSRVHLLVVGANHVTAPIGVRETLVRRATYDRMRYVGGSPPPWEDIVLLTTCNRIEAYAVTGSPGAAVQAICRALRLPADSDYLYLLEGEAAVDHLLRVATGLESMAQGEGQVLTQVRRAALSGPAPQVQESLLTSLFVRAVRSAQRIRAAAGLVDRRASASWSAFRFIAATVPIAKPDVVLLGTGKMARLAAEALAGRASLTFLGRDRRKARSAGSSLRGRSGGFRGLRGCLVRADVIVAATSRQKPVLGGKAVQAAIAKRSGRRLWLVDLGFPRNIDPRCGLLEGVTLVDIDGLAPWGWQPLPPAARARTESRIREETSRLLRLLITTPEVKVGEFRKAVEELRNDEVEAALARLPRLSPEEQSVIDKLATRLVNRLLHAPTEWLRTLPEDRSVPTVAELVHRLQSSSGR
jgi:glutamyl-tRNA reductase